MREKVEEILYDEDKDFDEIVEELKDLLKDPLVQEGQVLADQDVFDSPGLDIGYISVAWIENGKLNLLGTSYYWGI